MTIVRSLLFLYAANAVLSSPMGDISRATALPLAAVNVGSSRFVWGAIGDSWSSNVAYAHDQLYDNNEGSCMRTTTAYSSLMQTYAKNWVDADVSEVAFRACSGAQLVDMTKGQHQIDQVSKDSSVVLMHSGGNNVGFFDLLISCVFQPNPSATYDCPGALARARKYINGPDTQFHLRFDLRVTYEDLFNTPQAQHKPFHLYHIGYAHFFATDPSSNWCNDIDFGVTTQHQKLTFDLRQQFNALTDDVHRVIAETIDTMKSKLSSQQHLEFLDISPSFEGHRFCEGSMAPRPDADTNCNGYNSQYYNADTWVWNFQWSNYQADRCNRHNRDALVGAMRDNNTAHPLGSGSLPGGPQRPEIGFQLRPFHPKTGGNVAIGNAVIRQLAKDGVPGIKQDIGSAPIPSIEATSSVKPPAATSTIKKDSVPASATSPPSQLRSGAPAPRPSPPPAADTCSDWWGFWFDKFEIYGKDFNSAALGDSGKNLADRLQHCGLLKDWKFENLTNDRNGYQWHAAGNLPVGTKSCVGSALMASGGSSADGCTGSG